MNSNKLFEGMLKLSRRFKCRRHPLPHNNLYDAIFLFKRFINSVPKNPTRLNKCQWARHCHSKWGALKEHSKSITALKWNSKTKPSADLDYNWNPLPDCTWVHPNSWIHKASSGWGVKLSQQSFFKAVLVSCWSCEWLRFAQGKRIFTLQAVSCKCWKILMGLLPFPFFFSISAKNSTYSTSQSWLQTWKPIPFLIPCSHGLTL